MRYLVLMLTLLSLPAVAQVGPNCDGNTLEINACMAAELQKVEADLNATYARVVKSLSLPDRPDLPRSAWLVKLRNAQRAWVAFREKNCDAVYELNAGGSIRNMRYLACMRRHADARARELESEYLNE